MSVYVLIEVISSNHDQQNFATLLLQFTIYYLLQFCTNLNYTSNRLSQKKYQARNKNICITKNFEFIKKLWCLYSFN